VVGDIIASAGDGERPAYFRSAAKPFQALPLVESGAADAFGFSEAELALACASHNATPTQQRGVARMLAAIGVDADALRCGVSSPADADEGARFTLNLVWHTQIQCECSGEHAGMVAVCQHLGYPLDSYANPDHPLQQRIREIISSIVRLRQDEIIFGTDGCSIPTFGAPLRAFAVAYATLAAPDRAPTEARRQHAEALARLRAAMLAHPDLVGGDGVLDTDIMRCSQGQIVAKLGAEGLLCMAVPDRGLGIAIADESGSTRGLGPAAVAALAQLDLIEPAALDDLRRRHCGTVRSFAGAPVGEIRPALQLVVETTSA
jgi:L-asparaginase II